MDVFFTKLITTVALPPGFNLALIVVGSILCWRWRRLGMTFIIAAVFSLYVFSMPLVARFMVAQLEVYPALAIETGSTAGAGAIVVLGGGLYRNAPEYGSDVLSSSNLARLRYGAYLHRRTELPLLVTGGRVFGEGVSEAELMERFLTTEQSVSVRWTDPDALNTAENARNTWLVLQSENVRTIVLVTHALHMGRALNEFEKAGFSVIPAPVEFKGAALDYPAPLNWLPSATALSNTGNALHEFVGRLWYWLRYR